jgi:hypothetical protein
VIGKLKRDWLWIKERCVSFVVKKFDLRKPNEVKGKEK